MASIVETIIGDKALQLGGEEFVRKMRIGNNWNFLRIAGRVRINGATNVAAPRMMFGLCNGDTDTFASSSCAGYIGSCPCAITNSGGGAPLNYDGVNFRYTYSGPGVNSNGYVKKLGSTVTEAQGGTNGTTFYMSANTGVSNYAGIIMADFIRLTSSSYQVGWAVVTAAQWANNPRYYDMLRSAEDTALSAYGASYITPLSMNTTNFTGLPSNFDTVSVYWNKTTPTIDLFELVTIRFY